jgi:hypothetical protein
VKIFVVSLHRCATQSANRFLEQAGLKTYHWPSKVDELDYESHVIGRETNLDFIAELLRPVFDRFDAVSDVPVPVLYRQLDTMYRGARFVAIRRDPASWVEAVRRYCGDRLLDPYERTQYWRYLPDRPVSLAQVSDADLLAMYDQHYYALREHFFGRENFGLFDLGDDVRLGAELGAFLGTARRRFPRVDVHAWTEDKAA